ncbi:MAG: right-handed parallel beta-helix repeat-containing protein [Bryobacterales bacterium]|nr:right-handed parallel beta-helix repeat-containing protein [Bryobacterales bacterium]
MTRGHRIAVVLLAVGIFCAGCRKESKLRSALEAKSGVVELPSGDTDLSRPLVIEGADGLTLRGDGRSRLRMKFDGRAAVLILRSKNVKLENFALEGNREPAGRRIALPPSDQPMARWNPNNGILVEDSQGITISKLSVRNVVSYAVLVSKCKQVVVDQVAVGDSGSVDEKGFNNATGGILIEEGTEQFAVRNCKLRNIRGNGIWTHSLYGSPRNRDGEFVGNELNYIGRDALQAGHAVGLEIQANHGGFIGFPAEIVDVMHGAVPVAIDTAGNVEGSAYVGNSFEEVNGKCIDLDGFHDGVVQGNECANRRDAKAYPYGHYGIVLNNSNPDMQSKNIRIVSNTMTGFRFGGLFLIGQDHVARGNIFRNVNTAHCNDNPAIGCLYKKDEPDLLRSGIYLGKGAERPAPAARNVVENNTVQGYGMSKYCIVFAPGVKREANTVRGNKCEE